MRDPRERFSKAAELYARWRPGYPPAVIEWIVAQAGLRPGATVVDLGCGTGIATRLFAARGFDVVGVDANEEMLAHARAAGGARYLRGEASATGLPAASADLAIAAQAFHWFDLDATLAELRRVLRPGARVAPFWNQRRNHPLTEAYERVLLAHSTEYRELATHADVMARLRGAAGATGVTEAHFAHDESLDWERFRGRVESSSFVAHLDDADAFGAELRALFDRYAEGGRLSWPYQTDVFVFGLADQ